VVEPGAAPPSSARKQRVPRPDTFVDLGMPLVIPVQAVASLHGKNGNPILSHERAKKAV
jgi:hypothetical protein